MNQDHHRQYAIDALRAAVALSETASVPRSFGRSLLAALGGKLTLAEFVDAAAAPDRIRDTCLTLPSLPDLLNPFPDTYSILGHNLSSFQHFECNRNNAQISQCVECNRTDKSAGYLWNEDASLTRPGEWATSELMEHLHTQVVCRPDPKGVQPPFVDTLASPMKACYETQKGKTLDGFEFPSASVMGGCYGDRASVAWRAGDVAGWRGCAGFACHFVHDALVPHHVWGNLLHGHSDWEDQIEAFWKDHLRLLQSTDPTGQLYKDTLCEAVGEELDTILKHEDVTSVESLIRENAAYTTEWLTYRGVRGSTDLKDCPSNDALRICVRAVASSVRALMLMAG